MTTIGPYSSSSSQIIVISYGEEGPTVDKDSDCIESYPELTKLKCGELLYSARQLIRFECAYCTQESASLEQFLKHLLKHDLKLREQNEVEENEVAAIKPTEPTENVFLETTEIEEVVAHPSKDDIELLVEAIAEVPHNQTIALEVERLNQTQDCPSPTSGPNARKAFDCSTCHKQFPSRTTLSTHYRKTHSNNARPYACDFCDSHFVTSSNLRVHRYRHLGIKPHRCSLCEKSFTSSSELKLHERTHTGERPYMCADCGQSFTNSAHLNAHRRRHNNERRYVCGTCGKSFYDGRLLRSHEVMHSNERPHKCAVCGASFTRHKALIEHGKLHGTERKYGCKICGKTYAQNAGLYGHLKKRHGVKL